MRIAYVYYLLRPNQLGVERKISQQARALAKDGSIGLELQVLNPWRQGKVDNIRYVKLRRRPFPFYFHEYLFRRYQLIDRSHDFTDYDVIILRYPLADSSGIEFVGKHRVVTEHHTNEPAEMLARIRRARTAEERIAQRLLLWQEDKHASRLLGGTLGIIGVSDDMKEFECGRAARRVPGVGIGNGVDVASIPFTGFKPFDGKDLNLLLVASSPRPWHGLDRVVHSFNQYRGSVTWRIHVVGDIGPEHISGVSAVRDTLVFHGPKSSSELAAIMTNMNLALSTMAGYRKNYYEGSPLKTREYTASGIPFILAYSDPDLRGVAESGHFFLECENDSSLLEVERVVEFAQEMSKRPQEISNYMREYARAHMDWGIKLRQYVEFVERVSRNAGEALATAD